LENKLNEEKNQNILLYKRNQALAKELEDEKNQNINLNKIIIGLNSQLDEAKELNTNLSNNLNSCRLNINELQETINMNNDEINILKKKINELYAKYSIDIPQPDQKILAIGFNSCDQKIHNFILPCKESALFVRIEEKLYEEYPDYKEKETYFLVGANKIKRFKTLKENNIKSGSVILLNIIEE